MHPPILSDSNNTEQEPEISRQIEIIESGDSDCEAVECSNGKRRRNNKATQTEKMVDVLIASQRDDRKHRDEAKAIKTAVKPTSKKQKSTLNVLPTCAVSTLREP